MSNPVIKVSGLGKQYHIGGVKKSGRTLVETLSDTIRAPFRRNDSDPTTSFWALKDVSFDIHQGDVVGIIGRNGAGKSTLLKVLSRITDPTEGEIDITGRIGSLLEVGTGFHPELTGRENVFLNGAILGMRKTEIAKKFDEIVAFAGTEKFLDTAVKHYSSGMYTRLAFAVAAHLDPEILIVDEVLAVGDAEFQKKCMGKMKDVAGQGRTVLFVSHNIAAIQNLCQTGIFLREGRIQKVGPVDDVISEYTTFFSETVTENLSDRVDRTGTGRARVEKFQLFDSAGTQIQSVLPGKPFQMVLTCRAEQPIRHVEASVDLQTVDGQRITTLYSGFYGQSFDVAPDEFKLVCDVAGLNLRPDHYSLNLWLGRQGEDDEMFDFISGAVLLEVTPVDFFGTGRTPDRAYGPIWQPYGWTTPPLLT